MNNEKAVEQLRCSEINFNNAVKWQPGLAGNPMFILALSQLHCALKIYDPDFIPEGIKLVALFTDTQ